MRTIPKDSDAALRAVGLRLTGPRRVILEVLRGTESHPTAERVHRLVRRRLPRVSLGTVYRNLRLLVAEGLAGEIPGPHARFDANLDAHHHFTCVRCEKRRRSAQTEVGYQSSLKAAHSYAGCAADVIDRVLPALEVAAVDAELHASALAAFREAVESSVSLVDRTSFAFMRRGGIDRAIALDAGFRTAGFATIP